LGRGYRSASGSAADARRDADGNVLVDTRNLDGLNGPAFWSPPLPPHTLESAGTAEIRVVSVESKQS
jgi:hypothetical protein